MQLNFLSLHANNKFFEQSFFTFPLNFIKEMLTRNIIRFQHTLYKTKTENGKRKINLIFSLRILQSERMITMQRDRQKERKGEIENKGQEKTMRD